MKLQTKFNIFFLSLEIIVISFFLTAQITLLPTLILLVIFITGNFFSIQIVNKIKLVSNISEKISLGNFQQQIPIYSNDEIDKLAKSINEIVQKLENDIIQLKKLEKFRSEFLGNVSHELRTPIFSLQASLETLLNGAIDDANVNRDFLQKALNNSHRLNELLSNLIEVSRIETGEIKMSFRYFSVFDFLKQIMEEFQMFAQQKNISLMLEISDEKISVYGDKDQLKIVFSNLISNAIKYTDKNGTVVLSVEKNKSNIYFKVKDTGIGISEENISRIFERFYRVDKNRSREFGGSGLGLAIVKHILEAHQTKIEVESKLGIGTTFYFELKST